MQFAKSVMSHSTKPTTVSTERIRSHHGYLEEDSVSESIQMAESISQSLRSQSMLDISKSRSEKKLQALQKEKLSPMQSKQKGDDAESNKESIIESDYSEDFVEQSIVSLGASNSKAKLSAKVKDIENSAAYSETFEEESISMSKSMTTRDEPGSKEPRVKMDTVKEESLDDSAEGLSCANKDTEKQSIGSSKASKADKEKQVESS